MIGTDPASDPTFREAAAGPAEPLSGAGAVLVGVCALLLFVGLWFNGAFALTSWAPLAILCCAAIVVLGPGGGRARGGSHAFAAALALFAIWTLVSTTWSDSPSLGVENGARYALYAALAALVASALHDQRASGRAAQLVVAGLGALVLVTLVGLAVGGKDLLLAGRLDVPVGYRNGTAAIMAMAAVALICVAAARPAHPALRAGALALAVAAVGLGYVTQSRGVVLGFAAGLVVVLALGPDRVMRAYLSLVTVGLVAVVSGPLLKPYDSFIDTARTEPSDVSGATRAIVFIAALAFAGMAVAALVDLRLSDRGRASLRVPGAAGLAVIAVVAIGGALLHLGNPGTYAKEKIDEFKTLEPTTVGATRLGSTSGQRYDLWRIAVNEFDDHPLRGGGEGSYPSRYYLERRTDRNLSFPHSLPLGVLGDDGLIGFVLLYGAFGILVVAVARTWRRLGHAHRRLAAPLLGAGTVLVAQASVDWLFSIAALAGIAILILAVGLRVCTTSTTVIASPRRPVAVAWRAVAGLALIGIACLFVSGTYVRIARHRRADPARSLAAARTAAEFAPFDLDARYLQAGSLESRGDVAGARDVLRQTLAREPRSFVTLALLGDLETRAGRTARARRYYHRAAALNPGDVGLKALADG